MDLAIAWMAIGSLYFLGVLTYWHMFREEENGPNKGQTLFLCILWPAPAVVIGFMTIADWWDE